MTDSPYRKLPAVNDVLAALPSCDHGHEQTVAAIREELAELRKRLASGEVVEVTAQQVAANVLARLERTMRPKLVRVINATGIVLHTNLGRAPMADAAAEAARQAAGGYLNLELSLDTGKRSSRQDAIRDWLCRLTGAESATAVNNNAAATVIVLRALAQGKEVILSRGQMVEIGGSFRVPEVMAVSGAILREVGTTNITRVSDYEAAIGPNTGALLRVHPSNYRVTGHTASVSLEELVALGAKHRLPVIDDIGSGALLDLARFGLRGEPVVRECVAAGADVVLFSGDKLLGGPQAGIIVGRRTWIEKIEKDPLMRALRLDKMTLSALEATLRLYVDEERALREVPVLRMLSVPVKELRRRAESLEERMRAIPGITCAAIAEDIGYAGGGSLPDEELPAWVVEVTATVSDAELAMRLRTGSPAVLARLRDGKVVFDVRTIFEAQEDDLLAALTRALEAR